MIFVWHHAEEKSPSWEVPEMPQLHDADWSEPREWEFGMDVHVQDMAENNLDPVHFEFVHKMLDTPPTEITYEDDGRVLHASSDVDRETPNGTIQTKLLRTTWGSVWRRWSPPESRASDCTCTRARPRRIGTIRSPGG